MKVLDIELYKDYLLVMFKNLSDGEVFLFEMYEGNPFQSKEAMRYLKSSPTITFNGNAYDLPLFGQACAGKTCAELKELSDKIIQGDKRPWELGIEAPACEHIDLREPAPGVQISLKMYGARMHMPKLQDLPIAHNASISPAQRSLLKRYCENDLDTTIALYRKVEKQIDLRRKMSAEYDTNLLSKSDAQIAEAVIKAEVQKKTGKLISKPYVAAGTAYSYQIPDFIAYQTEPLKAMLNDIRDMRFVIDKNGSPKCPALDSYKVTIGSSTYRMGVGGLHSSEQCVTHCSDANTRLLDVDATSYYPSIILGSRLYPKHIGPEFLDVYQDIVTRRVAAKRSGDSVVADSLKITINGSFGKFGSKYSTLYSPDLLIQTTVTGQLSLLMLIEWLELRGIPVVSANTDGIVIKCPVSKSDEMASVVKMWEFFTAFETEETEYASLHSRDVNNYIAVKPDGKAKTKGVYASSGLMKSPQFEIITDAVLAYLTDGDLVEDTIKRCNDLRKFVCVRGVTGGAEWRGENLGKVVRWYRSTGGEAIRTCKKGDKVARTDNAVPVMDLLATCPSDIDRNWYIQEAKEALKELGDVDAKLI